jgi:hypothetical protein
VSQYFDDDAFDEIRQDIIENQDLSRAVHRLKDQVDGELDDEGPINPGEIEQKLDSRGATIEKGLQQASVKSEVVAEGLEELENRIEEEDFRDNYMNNAVDASDWDDAWDLIDDYQQFVGELVLLVRILKEDRDLLEDAVDIQVQRVEESRIHDMTKEMIENMTNSLKAELAEISDEYTDRVDQVIESKGDVAEKQKEAAEAISKAAEQLKTVEKRPQPVQRGREVSSQSAGSATSLQEEISTEENSEASKSSNRSGGSSEDDDDLSDFQRKIYDLAQENPDWGVEKIADELDRGKGVVLAQVGRINDKPGYEDFTLDQESE